jgi:hypothetical protein
MENVQSASPSGGPGDVSPTGISGSASNSKMRKRTKTGCLTCRKRRIKCGEERPTCANCIKSKRQCEGYNQRVIFKPPIGDWPNHPGVVSTIQYHTSMLPGTRNQPYRGLEPSAPVQESMPTAIQPRPLNNFDFSHVEPGHPGIQQAFIGSIHSYPHGQTYQQPLQSPVRQQPLLSPHHQAHIHTPTASYFPQPSPVHTSPPVHYSQNPNTNYQASLQYTEGSSYPPVPIPYDGHLNAKPSVSQTLAQRSLYQQPYQSNSQQEAEASYQSHSSVSPQSDHYPQYTEPRPSLSRYNSQPQVPMRSSQVGSVGNSQAGRYSYPAEVSHADFSHSSYSSVQIPIHDMNPDVKYMPQPVLGMSRV